MHGNSDFGIFERIKMQVSDYIVQYMVGKEVKYAFGYPGGMVTYLIDSFSKNSNINAYALYHEQAAAFAACGYAQASGKIGVAYATSGPGATNLLTGICHAYYESVPTLFITGQVNTNEAKGRLQIRQKGFQETDIVKMVDKVTKYSAYIDKEQDIKYHLDKAFYYATQGRPGPVLLDIPIDIQRAEVDENDLTGFTPTDCEIPDYHYIAETILMSLKNSIKPVILIGNGIKISGVTEDFYRILIKLGVPVITSMVAVNTFPSDNKLNYGFLGAYGHRYANIIISKCDLLISFGSRLDIRQTGSNVEEFATEAKLIRIDIDQSEFENKIKENEIDFYADLKDLVKYLDIEARNNAFVISEKWINQCQHYKEKLSKIDWLAPNYMVEQISELIPDKSLITTDVGQNQVWISQSFQIKKEQKILFSGGHGSMGYSLPAAIGAYFATKKPVYCFAGDGGIQMNIQELQFVSRENIPVKIFILNNHSLGMIRHFQEMYFNSNFTQTLTNKGYSTPDFIKIGFAYGIKSYSINSIEDLLKFQEEIVDTNSALFDINLGDRTYVYPKAAYNKPIYNQEPELDKGILDDMLGYEGSI